MSAHAMFCENNLKNGQLQDKRHIKLPVGGGNIQPIVHDGGIAQLFVAIKVCVIDSSRHVSNIIN